VDLGHIQYPLKQLIQLAVGSKHQLGSFDVQPRLRKTELDNLSDLLALTLRSETVTRKGEGSPESWNKGPERLQEGAQLL
jgi:hypothetical protein